MLKKLNLLESFLGLLLGLIFSERAASLLRQYHVLILDLPDHSCLSSFDAASVVDTDLLITKSLIIPQATSQ